LKKKKKNPPTHTGEALYLLGVPESEESPPILHRLPGNCWDLHWAKIPATQLLVSHSTVLAS